MLNFYCKDCKSLWGIKSFLIRNKIMFQEKNQILWNKKVAPSYFNMGLTCGKGYSDARPGQFVTVKLPNQTAPLLRRPFSIHKLIIKNHTVQGIELLYKVIGTFTEKLSMCKSGDIIDVLGPLGNSFPVSDNMNRIFIVAGGIGVAPMLFLSSVLKEKFAVSSYCKIFIGGRSADDILCKDDFLNLGMNIIVTTDDGSEGEKGLVTVPLERELNISLPDVIYACGPALMLKAVSKIAEKYAVLCYISVETLMACGMGACLGCAVEKKNDSDKYMHVCIDGPVFEAGTLV